MVNYDLPWNPNRLEQRFGRIHRIGQTEVCHVWNLVAHQTREGDVYGRLLEKLAQEAEDLGGQVFDVLGELTFGDRPLRQLLIEAVRAGDSPEVRAEFERVIEGAVDRDHLRALLDERALGADVLDSTKVQAIREDMDRANARRLQPHFIRSFFLEAFRRFGGTVREREPGRFEVTRVPGRIRDQARAAGLRPAVLTAYERITFDKDQIAVHGLPLAEFICPGHPLLEATIDLLLEQHRDLLRRGTVLVDESDAGKDLRVLLMLEDVITDQRPGRDGRSSVASRRLQFIELLADGTARNAGPAPYQDYAALDAGLRPTVDAVIAKGSWLEANALETRAVDFAVERVSRQHLQEVRDLTLARIAKTRSAVNARLNYEINYWDNRGIQLALQEEAGKTPKLNSANARAKAQELSDRLQSRLHELDLEAQLDALPPLVVGGAIVIPGGLLSRLDGRASVPPDRGAKETKRIELLAMAAVMRSETDAGFEPRDVSAQNLGYDIESRDDLTGRLRYIEVKGRAHGATTVTVTRNEILCSFNAPEQWHLAIVSINGEIVESPVYLRAPFQREPDFGATSVNYAIRDLKAGPVRA
jgi:hypothetical protein